MRALAQTLATASLLALVAVPSASASAEADTGERAQGTGSSGSGTAAVASRSTARRSIRRLRVTRRVERRPARDRRRSSRAPRPSAPKQLSAPKPPAAPAPQAPSPAPAPSGTPTPTTPVPPPAGPSNSVPPAPPAAGPSTGSSVLFRGDFEGGSFAGLYVQSLSTRASVLSGGAFGSGHAARFEVQDGDVEPDTGSERSEITPSVPDFAAGQEIYVRDSIRVPSGSSIGSSWTIVNQLHESNWGGSPGVAVFLHAGPSLRIAAGDGSPTFAPKLPIQYDRWHDLVYRVKLSADPAVGFVEVWLDGVQQVLAGGQTRVYGTTIQAARTYLKAGIYRGRASTGTTVVEHDNVIVGTSLATVTAG